MDWSAIGAIGEILGAIAVALTLGYFAIQFRAAKDATADANRLERARGVREIMLATSTNDKFRETITKGLQLSSYYEDLGNQLDMSPEQASSFDWAMLYWFWLHWGQHASETSEADVNELTNVINVFYRNPGVRFCWENSPWAKPALESDFVEFVDNILAKEPNS
jgi:hypothetical protein